MYTLLLVSLLVLFFIPAFADTTFSGESHGNKITLSFSDGVTSGNLTLQNEIISLDGIKVIEKNNRLYMFDAQNDLKILAKQINSEKYLIIVKHSDEKLRFLATMDSIKKNIGQRDLFGAMEEKQEKESDLSFKGSQILEKNDKLIKAQQQHEKNIENLTSCQNKDGTQCLTSSEILENFEKSKIINSNNTYNVPVIVRDSDKAVDFILRFALNQIPSELRLGDKYEISGIVSNAKTSRDFIDNANVEIEISRDDYVIRTMSNNSEKSGIVRIEMLDLSYPEFYPTFCYDVKITTTYLDYTHTINDEFVMNYVLGTVDWNPDLSWLEDEEYDYLPLEFEEIPRERIDKDDECY